MSAVATLAAHRARPAPAPASSSASAAGVSVYGIGQSSAASADHRTGCSRTRLSGGLVIDRPMIVVHPASSSFSASCSARRPGRESPGLGSRSEHGRQVPTGVPPARHRRTPRYGRSAIGHDATVGRRAVRLCQSPRPRTATTPDPRQSSRHAARPPSGVPSPGLPPHSADGLVRGLLRGDVGVPGVPGAHDPASGLPAIACAAPPARHLRRANAQDRQAGRPVASACQHVRGFGPRCPRLLSDRRGAGCRRGHAAAEILGPLVSLTHLPPILSAFRPGDIIGLRAPVCEDDRSPGPHRRSFTGSVTAFAACSHARAISVECGPASRLKSRLPRLSRELRCDSGSPR